MNAARLREISKMAKRAQPDRLHALYMEVYGADFAGKVTGERARASIREACAELLSKAGKALEGFDQIAPLPPTYPVDEAAREVAEDPGPTNPVRSKSRRLEPAAPRRTKGVRKPRTLEPL